jgi:hypothetical protein
MQNRRVPSNVFASKIPLLEEEGWLRGQRKDAKPPLFRADGVVSSAKSSGLKVSPV